MTHGMNETGRNPLAGLIEAWDAEVARIEADAATRLTNDERLAEFQAAELASGQPIWVRRCSHPGCVITASHKHGAA